MTPDAGYPQRRKLMQPMFPAPLRSLPAVLATALVLGGCGDEAATETGSTAQVRVSATNSPTTSVAATEEPATPMFASAVVTVGQVYLVSAENESEQIPLMGEKPVTLDLVNLDQDLPVALAEGMVPAGRYSQLRVVVESAIVTLADGLTFDNGETVRELAIPSGSQTGIKVNILGTVEAPPGSWSSLLVDFDVSRNFVVEGNADTPAGIKEVLFKPQINEVSRTSLPSDDEETDKASA
jgi:hypothetical protein